LFSSSLYTVLAVGNCRQLSNLRDKWAFLSAVARGAIGIHTRLKESDMANTGKELHHLQIDVTQSMCLNAQRSITSQQEDLEKILPTLNSLSPVGIKAFEKSSHETLLFPILRATTIGQGASSKVFQSVRLIDLKLCAEKVIVVGDTNKRQQLVREIELLESLCCEPAASNIVQLYGILPNPTDGTLSILLEYMDMGSLQYLVSGGGCADETILSSLAYQITSGLAFLHKRRFVHRDIKPSNILLSSSGKVKLSDFGIARSMEVGASLAESFVGTFEYMSPERLSGEPYSFVSDIWSLGMTMHSVAIGRYPFSAKGDFWEILQATQKAAQLLPSSSQFSREFISFIASTTDLHVEKRPHAEALLTHPFLRSKISTLSQIQIEILRSVFRQSKQWKICQTNVGRISIDHSAQSDFISLLVKKWKDMICALYSADETDHFLPPNPDAFKEITVTKEMLSDLSKSLVLNEERLRRSFRKVLQETRVYIGDRLRFLENANKKDSNANASEMKPLSNPLSSSLQWKQEEAKMNLLDRQYLIQEQDETSSAGDKSRPQSQSIPSIPTTSKASNRFRKSEDCLVNLSSSINHSLRCLAKDAKIAESKDDDGGKEYADDDFVDDDSEDKYNDYEDDRFDEPDLHYIPKVNHRYDDCDKSFGDDENTHQSYHSDFEQD
jgi:mitogen-activated protein kinase kinase 1